MNRKRNTAVFIDGENIAAKKADKILRTVRSLGVIDTVRVYGLQKDMTTHKWSEIASATKDMKDIRLYGGPGRNKVDKKIQCDTLREIRTSRNVDIIVIVSSDHGYANTICQLRSMGKHVIVMGESKTPKSLRNACNEFIQI